MAAALGRLKSDPTSYVSSDSDKCVPVSDAPQALLTLFVFIFSVSSTWLRSGPKGAGLRRSVLKLALALQCSRESGSRVLCLFCGRQAIYTRDKASNWPIRDSDCFPPDQ